MSDAQRQSILAGITQVAPQSPIYGGSTPIQASYANLVKKGAALKTCGDTVAADRQKLKVDIETEVLTRSEFDLELHTLATLTESLAKTAADLASMGFTEREPVTIAKDPPPSPESILVKPYKRARGKVRVTAQYGGPGRPHFVAEWTADAAGATGWAKLVGAGASRVLTGAPGAKLWVRFAAVRGSLQSEWCTAVLVTMP